MTKINRSIGPFIQEFLDEKLVLVSGPRQVGKTFLSKHLEKEIQYFNFDNSDHKMQIFEKSWIRDGTLVVLDEIQKFNKWKSWIKGVYDTEKGKNRFLLTGSSRMDTFRKTGDSLAGRHFSIRLNPLSLREVGDKNHKEIAAAMIRFGSFPEPFLIGSDRKASLWRKSHLDIILRQDLILIESLRNLQSIELLVELLKQRVGQQIVYKNLADQLQVSPATVKKWIQVLESLFVIFVVYPYTKNVAEAVKKEPKIYFYDIGQITADFGFRLENLVALHLLKRNQFLEDSQGHKMRLCYIRDKKKREIDFVTTINQQLEYLIEVKSSDDQFNPHLNYFSLRLKPKQSLQLVYDLKRPKDYESHKVRSLSEFLFQLET